jgi:hypothetical protein
MRAKEAGMAEAAEEKAALKRDLERILRERGTLDSLRRLVLTTMAGAQGQQAGAGRAALAAPQAILLSGA